MNDHFSPADFEVIFLNEGFQMCDNSDKNIFKTHCKYAFEVTRHVLICLIWIEYA